MSFFGLTKQFPVVRFLIAGLFWKVGNAGLPSPFLSHAKRALYLLSYIFFEETVNAIVERSFRMHIVLVMAMSMRVINPFVSHMPMDCLFDWAATMVWSNRAIHVRGKSLIHMSVEQCSLRRLREVSIGDSGHQSLSHQALPFQMLPVEYWTYLSMFFFDLTNQIPVAFVSWFPVFSEKMEMRGIHPRSSRLRNERSTFWATSPLRKLVDKDVWTILLSLQ